MSPSAENSDRSNLMAFPTFDPNYIMRHAAFDPSILLYGIRGEYERKFQQYQQLWRQKWEELDQLNKDLHRKHSEHLQKEIDCLENQYFRDHYIHMEKPCRVHEQSVIDCYGKNYGQPLLCRREVEKFSNCVETNRLKLLKEK
ncbi:hypothetical protein HUG17_0247 [Dermatophagoides farinae]|nr:uncharacterized protein LOC124499707 [Dermatophagoides farinae]KAH7644709.1 hypothetical protein HUG17_0247 [Dermatophagoides farinae]